MRNKRSAFLSIILTGLLVAIFAAPVFAADNGDTAAPPPGNIIPYVDVREHWAYDEIISLGNWGYMQGTGGGFFSPSLPVNRAELVTLLWKIDGEPLIGPYLGYDNPFVDISADDYYYYPVLWGSFNQIVTGLSSDRYGEAVLISREQIAVMLYRYAEHKNYPISVNTTNHLAAFADGENVSAYAASVLQWAIGNGIISGREDNTLDPQGTATRAETAVMVYRFIQLFAIK